MYIELESNWILNHPKTLICNCITNKTICGNENLRAQCVKISLHLHILVAQEKNGYLVRK